MGRWEVWGGTRRGLRRMSRPSCFSSPSFLICYDIMPFLVAVHVPEPKISKGRQVIKPEDIEKWQKDTWEFFLNDPELMAALQDPNRVFNQDKTPIQLGVRNQFVLAEKGSKLLYNVTSNTRDHITASFTVSASGGMVPPRCVFKGVRNVALTHLKDLPKMVGVVSGAYLLLRRDLLMLTHLSQFLSISTNICHRTASNGQ